jgi:hypothetical protein
MLFWEGIPFYSEECAKPVSRLGKNGGELLIVKAGDMYSNHFKGLIKIHLEEIIIGVISRKYG